MSHCIGEGCTHPDCVNHKTKLTKIMSTNFRRSGKTNCNHDFVLDGTQSYCSKCGNTGWPREPLPTTPSSQQMYERAKLGLLDIDPSVVQDYNNTCKFLEAPVLKGPMKSVYQTLLNSKPKDKTDARQKLPTKSQEKKKKKRKRR